MSNISVYTTPKLEEDSVFINNFLDDLLENYYSKKYGHGNTLLPEGFVYPTLQDLIQFSYPNYYLKSVGLYCNRLTTEVVLVYKANLHNYLLEALEHKHSRLVISLESVDRVLRFITPITPGNFTRLRTLFTSTIAERLSRRSAYTINKQKILEVLDYKQSEISLGYASQITRLVYKPELDSILQHSDTVKLKNDEFIKEQLGFFSPDTNRYGVCIRIAFSLVDNHELFNDLVTNDMKEKLIARANQIVKDIYLDIDTIKKIEDSKRNEKIASERLKAVNQTVIDFDSSVEYVEPELLDRQLEDQVYKETLHFVPDSTYIPGPRSSRQEIEDVELPKHPGLYSWEFKWLWLIGAVCLLSVLFLTWCFT